MGWLRRLFRRPSPRPPPWVNPQFLGVFAAMAVASGLLWVMAGEGPAPADPPVAAQEREAFVGFASLEELERAVTFDCDANCLVEAARADWVEAHPQARIVSQQPVTVGPVVLGYRIVYEEV